MLTFVVFQMIGEGDTEDNTTCDPMMVNDMKYYSENCRICEYKLD